MRGLFRTLRKLYREFYQFGDDELTKLIKEAEKQKEQLCDLRDARLRRIQEEEKLALSELRRAVSEMQELNENCSKQEEEVVQAVNALGNKMQQLMEEEMQHRAIDVINSIDYSVLTDGLEPSKSNRKSETESTNDNNSNASNVSHQQQKPKR